MIRITEETEDEVEFEISLVADIIGLVFSVDYFKNIGLNVVNDESVVYADSSKTEEEGKEKSLQEGDTKESTSLATTLSQPLVTAQNESKEPGATTLSQPLVTAQNESKESLQEGNDIVNTEPGTVKNEPETVKNEPGTVKNEPETVKNEPGTVKNEPETVKNEPGTVKNEPGTVKNEWEKPIQLGGKKSKSKRRGGFGSKRELTFPYKYIEMFIDNTRKAFSKTFSSAPSKRSQKTEETKVEEKSVVGETKSNIFSRMFEHPKTLEIKQENITVENHLTENPSGEPIGENPYGEKYATGDVETEKKGIFSFDQPHKLENKTPSEESAVKPLEESATEDVAQVSEENKSIPKKGLFKTETPNTLEEKKGTYPEKQKQGLFQINEPKTIESKTIESKTTNEQKLTEPSVTNSPDVLEQNENSVPNSAVATENAASAHTEKGDSTLLQSVDDRQTDSKPAVTSSYSIFDNIKMFLGFESKPQSTNISAGESHYKTAVVRIYKKGAVLTKTQYEEERKADSKNPELIDVSPEDGQTDLQREKVADDEKIQKENKERILSTLSSEERYEMKVKYDAISVQGDLVFYVYADAAALLHKEPTKIDFTLPL